MTPQKSKREIIYLVKDDPDYPDLLREIPNPPRGIYIWGRLPPKNAPRIAIVGTRKATLAGRTLAKKVAGELGGLGAVIVSGLAMGIDTAAHEGALEAGAQTIAVLGNGLADVYPRQNRKLAGRIAESGGAALSEYEPQTPALPHQFLERNRIISGLSLAVVIIEAPFESGALVTARLAAEQGREVFVFPGESQHPNYRGSHKLIRDGARLVASAADIIEDLGLTAKSEMNAKTRNYEKVIDDKNQLAVLEVIRSAGEPLRVDRISELAKIESRLVSQALALLTVRGIIKETERGYTI